MRKVFSMILVAVLLLGSACGNKDKKTAVAIALADAAAGLTAWSDALDVLIDLGELDSTTAKKQLELNDKFRALNGQIADRLESGFINSDLLGKISELTDEAKTAADNGLLGIKSDNGKQRFREVTAFFQLSIATARNLIKAIDLPPVPDPVAVRDNLAAPALARSADRSSTLEKWTMFLRIGQDFGFAVIRHNRLDFAGAIAEQKTINKDLQELNRIRLAAL